MKYLLVYNMKIVLLVYHMTCHFKLTFSVWKWGDKVTMHCLTLAKRDLKMEKIRSPNDAWNRYLKT